MTLGNKIRTHRKALGLTQTELGEKLGVKVNAVSKWECGRVEDIPTSKIKALANLFGVQPSYLIDDETEQPANFGGLTDAEMEIIRLFRQLPPEVQDTFPALLEASLKAGKLL